MKNTILIATIMFSISAVAGPVDYFEVSENFKPATYDCTIKIENGEDLSGSISIPRPDNTAFKAMEQMVKNRSTSEQEVRLSQIILDGTTIFEVKFTPMGGAGFSKQKFSKLTKDSFCELKSWYPSFK